MRVSQRVAIREEDPINAALMGGAQLQLLKALKDWGASPDEAGRRLGALWSLHWEGRGGMLRLSDMHTHVADPAWPLHSVTATVSISYHSGLHKYGPSSVGDMTTILIQLEYRIYNFMVRNQLRFFG